MVLILLMFLVNKLPKECCIFKGIMPFMVENSCRIKVTKFFLTRFITVADAEEA